MKNSVIIAALACMYLSLAAHGDIIVESNGSTLGFQGGGSIATFGQTFNLEAGDESVLNSLTFWVNDYTGVVDMQVFVYEWDGTKATGDALFASDVLQTSGSFDFEELFVETGELALETETDYVWFGTSSSLATPSMGTSQWQTNSSDVYDRGHFVYLNNGSDFSRLTVDPWGSSSHDIAMNMQFSPAAVPEPASVSMIGLGLLGLGLAAHRRKR
jgi:hypothetical protein